MGRSLVAMGAALAVGATGAGVATLALRKWKTNPDPLAGRPMVFPQGDVRRITTDDAA